MSSYPPPPIKLPPPYLPLPHGQLGPANPFPFPNPQQFYRSSGQFHPSTLTRENSRPNPELQQLKPYPSPGQMRWPQAQFKPQKWVTQYAGPDQDFGSDCGCDGGSYGGGMFGAAVEGAGLGLKTAAAIGVAAVLVSLLP